MSILKTTGENISILPVKPYSKLVPCIYYIKIVIDYYFIDIKTFNLVGILKYKIPLKL